MPKQEETFSLDRKTLYALFDFYKNLYVADAMYQPCQDKPFRQHAKACLSSANIKRAITQLGDLLGESL